MKKILAISFAVVALAASAQDTVSTEGLKQNFDKFKSKRGVTIFPEKGEWSLGISANPILQYVGNAFSGATSTNQAPQFRSPGVVNNLSGAAGNTIFVKYMKTESVAYRARIQFDINSTKLVQAVQLPNVGTDGLGSQYGQNTQTDGRTAIMLGLGMEKRRGKDRIKGVYGAEGLLGFYTQKINSTYALPLENTNFQQSSGGQDERRLSYFYGNEFFVGLRAFVGVEYFFAPKISLGGEVGYTAGVSIRGRDSQRVEVRNPSTGLSEEINRPGSVNSFRTLSAVGFGVDNFNASINMHFYF